jgi:uncharacterized protein (TIGR02466 family)
MFDVPFVHKNITIDTNRIVNSIREHTKTLKIPNPWAKQSHVITSIAAGGEDAWQDEELFQAFQPALKEYIDKVIGLNVKLSCHMWYNIYNEGFHQEQHNHISSGNLASGIIYVQMPKKSTATRFINPDVLFYNSTEYKEEFKYFTPIVKEGDVIIFPPWVEHRVDKQFDITNTRITVAFNISNK